MVEQRFNFNYQQLCFFFFFFKSSVPGKDREAGKKDDEEEKEAGEIAMKPCCLPQVPPPLDGGVPGLQM